jgi:ankyrin repeat protein
MFYTVPPHRDQMDHDTEIKCGKYMRALMEFYNEDKNIDNFKYIIDRCPYDINSKFRTSKYSSSITLLEYACCNNRHEIVEYLISRGADINFRLEYEAVSLGETEPPLLLAVIRMNAMEVFDVLIRHGADITQRDNTGQTALHYAARYLYTYNSDKITKTLLDHGADVNVRDADGKSPLGSSIYRRLYNVAKLLLEYGAEVELVHELMHRTSVDMDLDDESDLSYEEIVESRTSIIPLSVYRQQEVFRRRRDLLYLWLDDSEMIPI